MLQITKIYPKLLTLLKLNIIILLLSLTTTQEININTKQQNIAFLTNDSHNKILENEIVNKSSLNLTKLNESEKIKKTTKPNSEIYVQYTEDVNKFKTDNINLRMQTIIGCMVITQNYIKQNIAGDSIKTEDNNSIFHFLDKLSPKYEEELSINKVSIPLSEQDTLFVMKKCMKKIKRKEAISAITSLAGRNIDRVLTLTEFISQDDIKEIKRLNLLKKMTPHYYFLYRTQKSQFDELILSYIYKFREELKSYKSKDRLTKTLDEELKKRTYHYFGFIPANQFTHTIILVTFSTTIVFCCTCYRYGKRRQETFLNKKKQKLLKEHQKSIKQISTLKRKMKKIDQVN